MISVEDYYKKDCSDDEKDKNQKCRCRPSYKYGEEIPCSFNKDLLVTDIEDKKKLLKDFGYKFPENKEQENEALAYIEEFPIYVLRKTTLLCHSTSLRQIFKMQKSYDYYSKDYIYNDEIRIIDDPLWWTKYYVGQKKYKGGWFTYETSYGGPNFGINLYYYIQEDIPLLFVPNYRIYLEKEEHKQYYFPPDSIPLTNEGVSFYSGSHLVKGPHKWREKEFPEIIPKYYADEFTARLVSLGFFGYISCDECEVFITHDTMKKAMYSRPVQAQVSLHIEDPKINQQILDSICNIFSDKNKCQLDITEENERQVGETKYFNLWNLDVLLGPETQPKMTVDILFNRYWKMNGILHRKDGPAIIRNDGSKEWYFLGRLHRIGNLPAIERADGTKEWYKGGKLHREGDLPAIEKLDGEKKWFKNGLIHREGDLPAVEYPNGDKYWYKNGERHREGDLPAVVWGNNNSKEWWVNGKQIRLEWYNKDGQLHREDDLPALIWGFNEGKEWYKNGQLHRDKDDLPALIYYIDGIRDTKARREWWKDGKRDRKEDLPTIQYGNGAKQWHNKDGLLHRENDLPAVILLNGTKYWYRNGELHRENKPAIVYDDESKLWYRNGLLHREGGPAIEKKNSTEWYKNGLLHSEGDLPAVTTTRKQEWWKDGKLHRKDGPAIIRNDGSKEWWVDGKLIREEV